MNILYIPPHNNVIFPQYASKHKNNGTVGIMSPDKTSYIRQMKVYGSIKGFRNASVYWGILDKEHVAG